MPIYFYSCDEQSGKIRAMTGVKGLMFPESDAAEAFQLFWSLYEEFDSRSPNDAYADAVKKLHDNDDFSEEIDHFSILSQTATARTLYVWNIICRISFTAFYKNKDPRQIKSSTLIHREISRYNIAHMHFFLSASPILEVSYEKRSGRGSSSRDLHAPDIQAAKCFLDSIKKIPDHASVARTIDESFMSLWRKRKDLGIALFYKNSENPASFIKRAFILKAYIPAFTSLSAFLLVTKRFFELSFSLRRNFLKLITTGSSNQKVTGLQSGSAPAILSPKGQIDPVAFSINKMHWGSLEVENRDQNRMTETNLLWHILSRSAETSIMMKANISKHQIETHFESQWDFYASGFVEDMQSRETALAIDYCIIDEFEKIRANSPDLLNSESKISEIAIGLFLSVGINCMDDYIKKGKIDEFSKAFGTTYMQV